jgi:HK97 family phage prohead protease
MPYHTGSSESCPASKPHAVIKDSDGEVMGCHATKDDAKAQLAALHANEGKRMAQQGDTVDGQLLLKAAATATEQGQFTAIAAAYTLDRDKERIRPGAFANTIKAWQERNRPIPLHWAHEGGPDKVIGSVDPHSMAETDQGLYVAGALDLEGSEIAKEAWRLVKADTVSLSFGFLGEVTPRAKDGTREITNIDLYEVSLTPAPANPDTRFLSLKAVKTEPPSEADIRRELDAHKVTEETKDLPDVEPAPNPVDVLAGQVKTLADSLDSFKGEVEEALKEPPPELPSEAEVRHELQKHKVDEETKDLPKAAPAPSPMELLSNQVESFGAKLEQMMADLDEKLKAVAKTVEEPRGANSVEDERIRRDATKAVVDLHSDGVPRHKPPKQDTEPDGETEPDWSLKARTRREIYELLTEI